MLYYTLGAFVHLCEELNTRRDLFENIPDELFTTIYTVGIAYRSYKVNNVIFGFMSPIEICDLSL